MSSTTAGYTEEGTQKVAQKPMGTSYIPTKEEKRVFKECAQESFWYRSLPFSVLSMGVTRALLARGALTPHPKFGSIPKVFFAGFCGYFAGKMSYMGPCKEKFKSLENSPLGEAIRKGLPLQVSKGPQSEMSDPDTQSFDTMFQAAEAPSHAPVTQSYDYNSESPVPMGKEDDFSAPGSYIEDEEPRKKSILYEDLRGKNRENYEVTLTQKSETLLKPSPDREPGRPRKDVKNNIYGDSWEE
ncbi:OCIA domain-containing protein 1-like [Trematomus bernacchii]|uniref:OCIA domain-containing protein 1-like n=1 Tax=Trematomus bernacchii TaxID=40690 RepID=UPI00146BED1E|nr:OCIA domain-containing protein 1-like [Trematomus bernacchii]